MHHEANVRLVDAHAERHRRHHNLQVIALEFFLHISANIIFQPGMIGRRANSLLCRRAAVSSTFARLLQ